MGKMERSLEQILFLVCINLANVRIYIAIRYSLYSGIYIYMGTSGNSISSYKEKDMNLRTFLF